MIIRDVNELTIGISVDRTSEKVDDAALDFDLLEIKEGNVRQVDPKQTVKRKDRPRNNNARPTQHWYGLEEARRRTTHLDVTRNVDQVLENHQVKMMKSVKYRPTNKSMTQHLQQFGVQCQLSHSERLGETINF